MAHFTWPAHHLTCFTPVTPKAFVERAGANVEMIATEGPDIVDCIWTQREKYGRNMDALEEIGDRIEFFINGSLYAMNVRLIIGR
jgi:hypothetical protein